MKIMFAVLPSQSTHFIPYGICIVATVAKYAGLNVQIMPGHRNEAFVDYCIRLADEIRKQNIDVVAVGGHSTHYTHFECLIRKAKDAGAITVLGGIIVDSLPELVASNIGADYCIYGEGEYTFVELIETLQNGMDVSKIPGLVYFQNGQLTKTTPRDCVPDLDVLPFIDGELCHYDWSIQQDAVLPIELSRSCPYSCTFCYKIKGSSYRAKSLERFFSELDHYISQYGEKIKEIFLLDDLFCADKSRLLSFCMRIKDYKILFSAYIRADLVDEECIIALKQAGIKQLYVGIESASNRILTSMRKNTTVEQVDEVFALAEKHDMVVTGKLIIGDVEEDIDTVKESEAFYFKHVYKHNVYIALLRVYPGSKVYQYAVSNGIIQDELSFLEDSCPPVNVSRVPDKFFSLFEEKYRAYDNARFITRQLRVEESGRIGFIGIDGAWSFTTSRFSCICSNCYMRIENLDSNKFLVRTNCPYCHIEIINASPASTNSFPVDGLTAHLVRNLSELQFDKYHGSRIIIWGLNDLVRHLLIASQTLRNTLVKIVDVNYRDFAQESYCGLSVEHPDALEGLQFDYILTPTVARRGEVVQSLRNMGFNEPKFIEIEPSLVNSSKNCHG